MAVADPRDFNVNARPIFESTVSWANAPIAVEIENKGPDARGQLLLSDEGKSTRYPIELPTGSKKSVIVYPTNSPYGMQPELFLSTNQGRFQIPYVPRGSYSYGNTAVVALISDNAGDLGFLKQTQSASPNAPQNFLSDAYCKPEDASDRPIGYQGCAAVVLGSGSDRISDGSVKALKSYALTGGTVIFIGGASATTLSDPRWADFLPASGFKTRSVGSSRTLADIAGRPFSESLTIAAGTPISSAKVRADGNVPIIAERGFGIGKVVLFAFNPFEDPVSRWQGRQRLFLQYVRGIDQQRATGFLSQFDSTNSYNQYDRYGGSGSMATAGGPGYAYPMYQERQDPFSVELPKASKVFWILAAFFVAVVPLNFLVLRKLGKGEWAWLSAPVISLGFAGVFLNQASDLYAASLSTATRGVLIVQEKSSESMFVGSTQIFFPNGGTYDLKMENVDQLGTGSDERYAYGREQNRTQLDPVDTGSIRIPDLRAANLAFEEIGYRQRFADPLNITFQKYPANGGGTEFTVRNVRGHTLQNVTVIARGQRISVGNLAIGQARNVKIPKRPEVIQDQGDFLMGYSLRQNVCIVAADITGLKPGPQLGKEVAGRSSVRLVYIAPFTAGGAG
ncbi:MAG: hypothetical protein H7Y17_09100 [Chlorobia bacterium]|nr:hypothetical protein [Fimbriimonadaceae bacterium]